MLEKSVYMIAYIMVQEEMASLRLSATPEALLICEMWGSKICAEEDSSLRKCDAVWVVI